MLHISCDLLDFREVLKRNFVASAIHNSSAENFKTSHTHNLISDVANYPVMPPLKSVDSLLQLCNHQVPKIVKHQVTRLTGSLVETWWSQKMKQDDRKKWNFVNREAVVLVSGRVREMEEQVVGDGDLDMEFREDIDQYDISHLELDTAALETVRVGVSQYREYLLEWPVAHLVDSLVESVIAAIEDALVERNSAMHLSDKPAEISKYNMEMLLLVKFLDLVLVTNLRKLDLKNKLQPVRNHLYDNLQYLPSLQLLDLGDASHGYTPHLFKRQFLLGCQKMNKIVVFSLHFDCFDELIACLSKNCSQSLKMIDIEMSRQVTDHSIEDMIMFQKLIELNIFSCGFTNEGQSKLLSNLPNLVHLKRGDFLCEALDWLDWSQNNDDKQIQKLSLKEFYYSEDYHFHTPDQMMLVSKWCPLINCVRFMFSKEHFISYQYLNVFNNIQSFHFCGGDFYSGR